MTSVNNNPNIQNEAIKKVEPKQAESKPAQANTSEEVDNYFTSNNIETKVGGGGQQGAADAVYAEADAAKTGEKGGGWFAALFEPEEEEETEEKKHEVKMQEGEKQLKQEKVSYERKIMLDEMNSMKLEADNTHDVAKKQMIQAKLAALNMRLEHFGAEA